MLGLVGKESTVFVDLRCDPAAHDESESPVALTAPEVSLFTREGGGWNAVVGCLSRSRALTTVRCGKSRIRPRETGG